MKKLLFAFILFISLILINPRPSHAACPGNYSNGDITVVNGENCTIPEGGSFLDKVTSETSATNNAQLQLTGGALTIPTGLTLRTGTLYPNGGIVYIQNGATIVIGGVNGPGIWVTDGDADGYANSFTPYYATASGRRRLGLMKSRTDTDCNDNSGTLWQNLNGYADTDGDGYGAGTIQSACSGATLVAGYVANNTDCNNSSALVYLGLSQCHTDADGDGHTVGLAANTTCRNNVDCHNTTKASASTNGAAVSTYATNRLRNTASANVDCYDANALAFYNSPTCATTHRGDSSYDYNCIGGQTRCPSALYANATWNQFTGMTNCSCRYWGSTTTYYVFSGSAACGATGYTRTSPVNRLTNCDADAYVCQYEDLYTAYTTSTQACQ